MFPNLPGSPTFDETAFLVLKLLSDLLEGDPAGSLHGSDNSFFLVCGPAEASWQPVSLTRFPRSELTGSAHGSGAEGAFQEALPRVGYVKQVSLQLA